MINLTQREFDKLSKRVIAGNEGLLFKNSKDNNKMVKIITKDKYGDEYFKIKMDTINLLVENREILQELPIALPSDIVSIDSIPQGYQSDFIRGKLLSLTLQNERIPLSIRIDYLKQVGSLLRKMAEIRATTRLTNLYYNDIHEENFIVSRDGINYGIDIDAFSIANNIPSVSKYSSDLFYIQPNNPKYKHSHQTIPKTSKIIPSENTDLYCYIRMILNFIFGTDLGFLSLERFYDLIDLLELRGADLEFLYTLCLVHDKNKDNVNPDYMLDCIKDFYEKVNINYDRTGSLSRTLKR